ncbi:DnaA ATPase domain-containing protein [Longimicrobium sp.]|uniref:DnaA/Hda family protein n=1 Tax=Longimicrobium sp. TaxID=2029185 RepID=UPI002E3410D1|nr:DnaA/Hda family protein [Longimicrobium sp.]HEX6041114.1 DnaA/Hda family protein [Longimicrobium sp.]
MIFSQDSRFTFDTFVVGPGNRMAAAAARRAAESPRTAYNPLLIYGAAGTGKTHLLQAVGALALAVRPDLRVVYLTADGLVDRVSAAVGSGSMHALRDELLEAELVLLDELHALAGKSRTQEELLALWDELEWTAQIVLAAESPSAELPGIEPELRARFTRGLAVDLPPVSDDGADSREEIARKAAEQRGIALVDGAAAEIARLPLGNAAGVVAAVERVGAAQAERGGTLDRGEVAGIARPEPAGHTPDEFSAFLSDIAATVEEIVETAPWRKRLAEAILRWEGEGIRTRRLEAALDADTAPDVDAVLDSFAADVETLRGIRRALEEMRSDSARSPVLADPDRVGEAEALLVGARAAAERKAEEAAKAQPQVDRWFFNAEKTALTWLALDDRLVEELA